MSFLAPLAFAFAAALPVVIVFYLLKRRRTTRLVSSTLLWQKFLAETQANAPFQKLRHNWLLILQLLLLALVVFALARPFLGGTSKPTRLKVLILDASASMQATDEKPSRFEKARADALKLVDGLRDGEQMMLLLAGASTEVKQSATSDKLALRRALEACAASDGRARITEALEMAAAFTVEKRGEGAVAAGEIHLFSDGAVGPLGSFENKTLPLTFHRVGQRAENLGIIALDVRANPDNAAQRAVFATVANFSTNALTSELELRFEEQVVEARVVKLEPKQKLPLVFTVNQPRDGIFTLRLTTADDLPVDNQASVVSLLPQPVKVLLVSLGNRFLERALRAAGNIELSVAQTFATSAPGADVVVLDDVLPPVWPEGNVLAIHTAVTNLFTNWSRVEAPAIVDWKGTHPLLRSVGFDNVQVAETLAVKPPPWAVPLVESQQTPLVLAGEHGRQRIVWVGFDTLQSTWPLRVSFPIFIANAVEWLNPAAARNAQLTIRAGDPFRLTLTDAPATARLTRPDGRTQELKLDGRELVVGDAQRAGIYRLKAGASEIAFAANLTDAQESDVAPQNELPIGKYARVEASLGVKADREIWRWLAAAGLGVLMFEWWWFHRRTA